MREIVPIEMDKTIPSVITVLRTQGIPQSSLPEPRVEKLAEEAIRTYKNLTRPFGILSDISKNDFSAVYYGEGQNEPETPLEDIYRQSESLALFAVTIGEAACKAISALFDANEFAAGAMLDTTASEATEMAAQILENQYADYLINNNSVENRTGILRFSPGYCGWHVSAQKKLFEYLKAEEIGIELNESYLMQPLKSISGVIITGRMEIFEFDDNYPFCSDCTDHACRDRARFIGKSAIK